MRHNQTFVSAEIGPRVAAWFALLPALAAFLPDTVRACAACYGQSDSPMAAGMNWGILSLLGVIVGVLGGIAACFIVMARRSALRSSGSLEKALAAQAEASWPVVATSSLTPEVLPLSDRGTLKPVSTLAQQRKHCTPSRSGSTRFASTRSRG